MFFWCIKKRRRRKISNNEQRTIDQTNEKVEKNQRKVSSHVTRWVQSPPYVYCRTRAFFFPRCCFCISWNVKESEKMAIERSICFWQTYLDWYFNICFCCCLSNRSDFTISNATEYANNTYDCYCTTCYMTHCCIAC